MEAALHASVKARPTLSLYPVQDVELSLKLTAGTGWKEAEEKARPGEESVQGSVYSYGSFSLFSSCLFYSYNDVSVRSFSSFDDNLICTLHHGLVCALNCSHKASVGRIGGCTFHKASVGRADDQHTAASCRTIRYASLCCRGVLCSGDGSSIDCSYEGSVDDGSVFDSISRRADMDGYMCSAVLPRTCTEVNLAASTLSAMGHTALGCQICLEAVKYSSSYVYHSDLCSMSSHCNSGESCLVSSCSDAVADNTISCHRGLSHGPESDSETELPSPLRYSHECKGGTTLQMFENGACTAPSCSVASGSSTACCDRGCHDYEKGTCDTFVSCEEGYGKPACSLQIHSDDKSDVRHGSNSLLCLQPREVNPMHPLIQGTSIRMKFVPQDAGHASCGTKKGFCGQQSVLRRGRELGRMFQGAVDDLDWQMAEDLIGLADKQRLNDWLCIAVDSFWFLCTHKELHSATRIMEKLVKAGADGFMRAALRTSFLASCVWACQSKTRNPSDSISVLADRLPEWLQECSGYELSSAEAAVKVKRMAEWALKRVILHYQTNRMQSCDGQVCSSTPLVVQLQLRAFKRFLELAGNRLSGEDYTEAFEAACFPLSLFAIMLDSDWDSGVAASAMQGLLGMLLEGGADNVNQCCLEAARSGSTKLLRMLLQVAQRNGIEVDVDVALGYASYRGEIGTMECLVDVGNAAVFLDPLVRAAGRGCLPVVEWFVEKGCQDMELCSGLMAAVSSNRVGVIEYLLNCIPSAVLGTLGVDIITAAAERSSGCLQGVTYLLQHNFLGSAEATYGVADCISKLDDDSASPELKLLCAHEWSVEAFIQGRKAGEDHYMNVLRVMRHACSPLRLKELPLELQVAIAYLPLYKECSTASCGVLLSQRLRGQLIEAALRLDRGGKCYTAEGLMKFDKCELVALLKSRLPTFLVQDTELVSLPTMVS